MPTYEYACKSCGDHVEVVQSFKDDPLTECPACGGPLRKVFGSIGIIFKGSGFYRTDSRMPAKAEKADKTDKEDTADTAEKKEPAKAESKAADSKADSSSGKDSSGSAKAATSSGKADSGEKSA